MSNVVKLERIQVVEHLNNDGTKPAVETDLTERVLMSLVFDISQLRDTVERVRVQVFTLAKEHGVEAEIV